MVLVLIKALDILELISRRNGQSITLTEISQELNINQATSANIINTMISKGYIEHIGKKKGYKLGPSAYTLTKEVSYEQELVESAKGAMQALTSQINESCLLGVLRNNKRFVLHYVSCNQDIQVTLRSEKDIYETASGRLLLAFLSDSEIDRFLRLKGLPDEIKWKEASTLEGLHNELSKIRLSNIAMTNFSDTHLVGFAVPIRFNGNVIAGLSVFLPKYRCVGTRSLEIIDSLRNTAIEIEN